MHNANKTLFDRAILRHTTLRNRLWRSATWLGLADMDGRVTTPIVETYRSLAAGGVGLIVTGLTSIASDDASIGGECKFYDDSFIEGHCLLSEVVHRQGCPILLQTAMIFTMNIPEQAMPEWQYPTLLGTCAKQLEENFGHSETLYACNTYQFADYSRYAFTYFSEEEKRRYRDEHFPKDLENAFALGQRLVKQAAAN